MSNFKVGDVVTLKKGLLTGEVDTLGKHFTISYLSEDGTCSLKGSEFIFKTEMFTKVTEMMADETIEIKVKGRTTYATLYQHGVAVKTANARCCPEDTLDFQIGAKLAFQRLTEEEKPKAKTTIDLTGFDKGKFAVNVKTREEAEEFLREVEVRFPYMGWKTDNKASDFTPSDYYPDCCISYSSENSWDTTLRLGYDKKCYFKRYGVPIVEYKPKSFNFEAALKPNTVVHCRTKELGDDFAKKVREMGIKWCTGGDFNNNHYNQYGKETCYNLNKGLEATYCDLDFYQREEFTVIEYTK